MTTREHLEQKTREELIEFIFELINDISELEQELYNKEKENNKNE